MKMCWVDMQLARLQLHSLQCIETCLNPFFEKWRKAISEPLQRKTCSSFTFHWSSLPLMSIMSMYVRYIHIKGHNVPIFRLSTMTQNVDVDIFSGTRCIS